MDRLETMEAFVRVVDAGSFTGAARGWGRSKAVVSKYVTQLEEHLGVRLLHRTTRSLDLTDAGRAHLPRCRQLLAMLEEAESQVRDDDAAIRGTLRVSAPPGLISVRGRALLASFARRYPSIVLDVDLTHRLVDLVHEHIDVALRLTEPADSSLIARRLGPAEVILVASPGYLDGRPCIATPEDLGEHRCVVDTNHRFAHRWPFIVDGERVVVPVEAALRGNSPTLVRDMAVEGVGVAMVPRLIAAAALDRGELCEVLPGSVDVRWSIWAVTSERRFLPARARVFIEHAREVFG